MAEGGFAQVVVPALLSAAGGFASGKGREGTSFRPIQGTSVQPAFDEVREEIRKGLISARALEASPLEIPGTDVSGFVGAARIPGAPSGLVGLFPAQQDLAAPRLLSAGTGATTPTDTDTSGDRDREFPDEGDPTDNPAEEGPGAGDDTEKDNDPPAPPRDTPMRVGAQRADPKVFDQIAQTIQSLIDLEGKPSPTGGVA